MRVFVGIALIWSATACSNVLTRQAPDPSSPKVEDSVLAAEVSHALRLADVDGYGALKIEADGGTVVLEGTLAEARLVDLAAATASDVAGVDTVVCRITVRTAAEEADS